MHIAVALQADTQETALHTAEVAAVLLQEAAIPVEAVAVHPVHRSAVVAVAEVPVHPVAVAEVPVHPVAVLAAVVAVAVAEVEDNSTVSETKRKWINKN